MKFRKGDIIGWRQHSVTAIVISVTAFEYCYKFIVNNVNKEDKGRITYYAHWRLEEDCYKIIDPNDIWAKLND